MQNVISESNKGEITYPGSLLSPRLTEFLTGVTLGVGIFSRGHRMYFQKNFPKGLTVYIILDDSQPSHRLTLNLTTSLRRRVD